MTDAQIARGKRRRIGILGAGTMGSSHTAAYSTIAGVEVAGIVGRNEDKVREVAQRFGIPYFTDPDKLISDPTIDAIDVCLPSAIHRPNVVAALENGKHVFCETPIATNIEDAEEMVQAASKHERILAIGLLLRSVAEYGYIREQVRSGKLGQPIAVSTYRFDSYLTPGNPLGRPHYGGAISELMNFDFDFLNWMLGTPSGVVATGSVLPESNIIGHACALVDYGNVKAVVEGRGTMPTDFPYILGAKVVCEEGVLEYSVKFTSEIPELAMTIFRKGGRTEAIDIVGVDPYQAECQYFVNCINGEADPSLLDGERALEALRLTLAAEESVRRNGARIAI